MKEAEEFDPKLFLSNVGTGRTIVSFRKGHVIFALGDESDAFYVIQAGLVTLRAGTKHGREAPIDIVSKGDFVGKESIAGESLRWTSAIALTDCKLLRIEQKVMMQKLAEEATLANAVCAHLLARNLHYMQDLVELRTTCCEKRLAQILLRLGRLDASDSPETTIPKLNQAMLAELVGTTRSRVSCFLNGFRNSGFIDYGRGSKELRLRPSLFDFYADKLLTPEPVTI